MYSRTECYKIINNGIKSEEGDLLKTQNPVVRCKEERYGEEQLQKNI
jgi:hypothetical protein